jgi:hypothetical protein
MAIGLGGFFVIDPSAQGHGLGLAAAASTRDGLDVSYDAMPDWISTMPFQHMLRLLEQEGSAMEIAADHAGRTVCARLDEAGSAVTGALSGLNHV